MKSILQIVKVEKKTSKEGRDYVITHVVLDDGMEAEGFGEGFEKGDKVQSYYDVIYDRVKIFKVKPIDGA